MPTQSALMASLTKQLSILKPFLTENTDVSTLQIEILKSQSLKYYTDLSKTLQAIGAMKSQLNVFAVKEIVDLNTLLTKLSKLTKLHLRDAVVSFQKGENNWLFNINQETIPIQSFSIVQLQEGKNGILQPPKQIKVLLQKIEQHLGTGKFYFGYDDQAIVYRKRSFIVLFIKAGQEGILKEMKSYQWAPIHQTQQTANKSKVGSVSYQLNGDLSVLKWRKTINIGLLLALLLPFGLLVNGLKAFFGFSHTSILYSTTVLLLVMSAILGIFNFLNNQVRIVINNDQITIKNGMFPIKGVTWRTIPFKHDSSCLDQVQNGEFRRSGRSQFL